jgi:hypothetical protein
MKERASWPMKAWEVRAILDGRKTQTRRVVRPQPEDFGGFGPPRWWNPPYLGGSARPASEDDYRAAAIKHCPYGVPGDRLWVREAWAVPPQLNHLPPRMIDQPKPGELRPGILAVVCYREGYAGYDPWPGTRWRPSIHMPRWASRLTLEIVSVRVERVQEISEEDARAEGVRVWEEWQSRDLPAVLNMHDPRDAYAQLWESINGPGSWAANPWVWVIEFRRIGE